MRLLRTNAAHSRLTLRHRILRYAASISDALVVSAAAAAAPASVSLFYNDEYEVPLPPMHRFPMQKYRLVRDALQRDYCLSLSPSSSPSPTPSSSSQLFVSFQKSPEATEEELASTHSPLYIRRYLSGQMNELEIRKTGFPWSLEHVKRSTSSVGGTLAATRAVLSHPTAMVAGHLAGGTHHAFYDYGEGFCIFSDIAVASNIALKEFSQSIKQIMIVDLDVHQGNGNASLFRNNDQVFTFSMHCKENYFSKKEISDCDIELPSKCKDEEYLDMLMTILPKLLDDVKPQLVFFQAGVDIFEHDKLGKMSISRQGLKSRNEFVCNQLLERQIKCVLTMGGGYPKDLDPQSPQFRSLVECHADVYRQFINLHKEATERQP